VIPPIRLSQPFQYFAVLLFILLPSSQSFADGSADSLADGFVASQAEPTGTWKVINYWSTSCAPCRVEIPELNSLSKELASANVRVLGVNFDDESAEATRRSARRLKIEFPNLTMAEVEAFGLTAPNVLPTTYILSPEDVVMAKLMGLQTRDSLITALVNLGVNL
jgi:thiol-disulfide isomerase/thioredoxin